MAESIRAFENSLRDFLINAQSDSYNTHGKVEYKYNNLKVYMDCKKSSIPHFWVSVNISAACYQLDPLEKIDGSMGSDERFIIKWASRPNINGELKNTGFTLLTPQKFLINKFKMKRKLKKIWKLPKKKYRKLLKLLPVAVLES